MSFVKEKLSTEELKKNQIESDDGWYVDKEKNLIFYSNGGNPRGPEKWFVLLCKNEKVEISSRWHQIGIGKDATLEWQDTYVKIPLTLQNQKQEIIAAVKEAFLNFNFFGIPKEKVTVKFHSSMGLNGRGIA